MPATGRTLQHARNAAGSVALSAPLRLGVSVTEEDVVETGFVRVFGDTEAACGVALGVGINYQDANIVGG